MEFIGMLFIVLFLVYFGVWMIVPLMLFIGIIGILSMAPRKYIPLVKLGGCGILILASVGLLISAI